MTTSKNLKDQLPRLATQPIAWSNDDFRDLGGDTPIEKCLTDMREAGFVGTEKGHKFSSDAAVLGPFLKKFQLSLASAWHSTYILQNPVENELRDWKNHVQFLKQMGSPVAIAAECTGRVYDDGAKKLRGPDAKTNLTATEWDRLTDGLENMARIASNEGLRLAYHYHMGTEIQTAAEIEELLDRTEHVGLVFDTGHATFAGVNPLELLQRHPDRIAHVHLKNIRPQVLAEARKSQWSFESAVRAGVFTVPGDNEGAVDFDTILPTLLETAPTEWWVVEAEQDPKKANPLEYAKKARSYIRAVAGV
jgi:inosose dehydratase